MIDFVDNTIKARRFLVTLDSILKFIDLQFTTKGGVQDQKFASRID